MPVIKNHGSGKVSETSLNSSTRGNMQPKDSTITARHSFANEFIQVSCQLHWLLSGPDQPQSSNIVRTEMHRIQPSNTTTVLRTHTYM